MSELAAEIHHALEASGLDPVGITGWEKVAAIAASVLEGPTQWHKPDRCPECGGPLDANGYHESEWADCRITDAQHERSGPMSAWPNGVWPTMEELATCCIAGGIVNGCDETANMPPEDHPRWCNRCPAGREGLRLLYGELPVLTYQPGWLFDWSCANGSLFLHAIAGEPHAKGFTSATGEPRGPMSWMWIVEPPFDPQWLLDTLAEMEDHERREWLKVDGVKVFGPHV